MSTSPIFFDHTATPQAEPTAVPPQPAVAPDPAPTTVSADAPPSEWFLEAPTGTRYRTPEAAVQGIAEKDATIQRLQQQLSQIQQAVVPQPQAPTGTDYLSLLDRSLKENNPALFREALQHDIRAEAEALVAQMRNQMNPLVGYAGFNRAVDLASSGPNGNPNIRNFVQSDAFGAVTKKWPIFDAALKSAASDPAYYETQVPQILQVMYSLAAQPGTAAPAPQPTAPPLQRMPTPTTTPAQPTAPTTGASREQLYSRFGDVSPEDWAAAMAAPYRRS